MSTTQSCFPATSRTSSATSARRCATSARASAAPEQRERLTGGDTELHNQELYEQLAELGWLGVAIAEEYGGSGGGMVDVCLFLEETIARPGADRGLSA